MTTEEITLNQTDIARLSAYIADYIAEENSRGNAVDKYMVEDAIDAFIGGADDFPDLVDFRGKPTMCRIIQRHTAGTVDVELPSGNCYRVSGLSTGQTA
jgi:hypothetical protein